MKKKQLRATLLLLLTALIWGAAFVAQDVAMDSLPPFTFNAARMLLGALVLLPVIRLMDARKSAAAEGEVRLHRPMLPGEKRTLLTGGVCCGVVLFVASSAQQLGINETSAGKAGFVTALYIVLVPVSGLFTGRRVRANVWAAVGLCVAGLYLLCVTESLSIGKGDIYLLVCALCFTVHILVVASFSPRTDCVRMSCIQFFVAALLCGVVALFTERPTWQGLMNCAVPILYAGILSSGVGYTLQMVGQRDCDPTVASLLMSLESLFAVLSGWIILGDVLSPRELGGCALMMAGIVLAQLKFSSRRQADQPAAQKI
ncbi:MAG: DMT family transporter [Eubacteriales bacterium]|nr:DMT family transporter [Eubacteriales bacterium]